METFVLRRADAVVTICDGLRGDVVARGVPSLRVTVVGNAVDRELLDDVPRCATTPAALRALAGRRVIGFFGSFYSYEGLDLLISVIPALQRSHPDVAVLLLGSGPEDANLRAQVDELDLGNAVTFVGRVPHADVAAFYRGIEVFVFPRRGMRLTELVTPLKPLEAMAAGALVIASDVGGHRELIADGVTGVLYRAGDGDALAEALRQALDHPDKYREMRHAARHYVRGQRTWPQVARVYPSIYESLGVRR
jgi:glycosyltransferase involved in cell wall biosynthesis